MIIRPICMDDFQKCYDIANNCISNLKILSREEKISALAGLRKRLENQIKFGIGFVADDCGVVGIIMALGNQIESLFIDLNWQNNGVGTLLLNKMENELAAKQVASIEIEVFPESVGFYIKNGYRDVGKLTFVAQNKGKPVFNFVTHIMAKHIPLEIIQKRVTLKEQVLTERARLIAHFTILWWQNHHRREKRKFSNNLSKTHELQFGLNPKTARAAAELCVEAACLHDLAEECEGEGYDTDARKSWEQAEKKLFEYFLVIEKEREN